MARKRLEKETALSRAAKILGRKGGKEGGPARAKALTGTERREIARQGGKASKGVPKTGR